MRFKLNPTREAAIQASGAAHRAVIAAEKQAAQAQGAGERAAATERLLAAREAARDADRAVMDEYQKARIANGDGPDPAVPNRR
ncbi:hypothetical protein AB0E27_38660 [Streptomyces sparsogenes]|uniref:hypothetical protein n=1 Tax=Streptomyces sparsogenes TaxID=67365 RepID=UPI0033EEC9FB